jgi:hypothetical protein
VLLESLWNPQGSGKNGKETPKKTEISQEIPGPWFLFSGGNVLDAANEMRIRETFDVKLRLT